MKARSDVTVNKVVTGGRIAPNKSRKRREPEEHNSPQDPFTSLSTADKPQSRI